MGISACIHNGAGSTTKDIGVLEQTVAGKSMSVAAVDVMYVPVIYYALRQLK